MAYTFTTRKNNTVITTTLYGEVTPERLEQAKATAQWRAEQLDPVRERTRERAPKRERTRPREDDDPIWDDPYQSTGR